MGKKEEEHPRRLPSTWTDRLLAPLVDALPPFLAAPFRDSQRQLVLTERRLQRRFLNEYRAQCRSFEPVLRARGALVGESILDAVHSAYGVDISYAAAEKAEGRERAAAAGNTSSAESARMAELVSALDPLIAPVLSPFVDGLKGPVSRARAGVEADVKKALAGSAAAGLLVGFAVGRLSSRRS